MLQSLLDELLSIVGMLSTHPNDHVYILTSKFLAESFFTDPTHEDNNW